MQSCKAIFTSLRDGVYYLITNEKVCKVSTFNIVRSIIKIALQRISTERRS